MNPKSPHAAARSLAISSLFISLSFGALVPSAAAAAPLSGWSLPTEIQTTDDIAAYTGHQKVAVNAAGEAFAIWQQQGAASVDLWANHFTPGAGWSYPTLLETEDSAPVRDEDVAINNRGEAVVVWAQVVSAEASIQAVRFTPQEGWSLPEFVEDDSGQANAPKVFLDDTGVATATWIHNDSLWTNVMAGRYTPTTGWEAPVPVEALNEGVYLPSIGGDATGGVMVLFRQWDSNNFTLFSNRYVPGSSWIGAVRVDPEASDIFDEAFAVSPTGQAVAVYEKLAGAFWNGYAALYDPDSGWGAPALLDANDGEVSQLRADIDADGRAVAGWVAPTPSYSHMFANSYTPGSGWGGALDLADNQMYAIEPAVALLPDGSSFAVWRGQVPGGAMLYSSLARPGAPWSPAAPLDPNHVDSQNPAIGVGGDGSVVCVFLRYDQSYGHTWASRYTPADIAAPPLVVTAPLNNAMFLESTALVTGSTEPGAAVDVNGIAAAVSQIGTFSARIALQNGTNSVHVTATDASANSVTMVLSVTFNDPLVAQLAQARANLTAAQQQVAALEATGTVNGATIAALQSALAAEQAQRVSLWEVHNTTNARLTALENGTGGGVTQAAVDGAAATAGLALLLGILGLVLGLVGIGLGARGMMKARPKVEAAHTNPLYNDKATAGENPLHEKKE